MSRSSTLTPAVSPPDQESYPCHTEYASLSPFWRDCSCHPAIRGQSVEQDESEAVQGPRGAATESKPVDLARVASLIVRKTNEFRKEQGRPEVEVDPELAETARGTSLTSWPAQTSTAIPPTGTDRRDGRRRIATIDTDCPRGGWLTGLDVRTGTITQANQTGIFRSMTYS